MAKRVSNKHRSRKFQEIEERLREALAAAQPEDLGTLSDLATIGGGGEPLGEAISEPAPRPRRAPARKKRRAAKRTA